jgi:hypothetical protein
MLRTRNTNRSRAVSGSTALALNGHAGAAFIDADAPCCARLVPTHESAHDVIMASIEPNPRSDTKARGP